MKRMRTLLGLCLFFASFVGEVAAVTLRTVGKGATTGGTVTVPVTVSGFASKLSMQFSLQWDQTVLRYSGISGLGLPEADLTDFNVTQVRVDAGQLSMAWVTRTGSAQSVADGTVVVNVAFDVIGATGTSSAIRFVDSPTATLVDDVPPTRDEGTVTVEAVVIANTPPTITAIADQSVIQSTATSSIPFTLGDAETPLDSLKLTKTSSNLELVPVTGIVLAGSGASRTVTVTPSAGKTGFATITLTVTDAGGASASQSFKLTVGAPNNPPTISPIANQVIWDGAASEVAFTIGDVETTADQLAVTVVSSNTEVIPSQSLALNGTSQNRTLLITPIVGTEGSTLLTLTVRDTDLGETTTTFTVGVTKRRIYVAGGTGSIGGVVNVPIKLSSQGNEAGLSFSLQYDPAAFSNPSVTLGSGATGASLNVNTAFAGQGKVGVSLLFSGGAFVAGEQQVVILSLTIGASAASGNLMISLADDPLERLASTVDALSLESAYQSGSVTLSTGLEGDVNPRHTGDEKVNLFDWVQTGRLAAKLDEATNPITTLSEFQRADTSPKATLGDGKINLFDWVQTGRYAAKLDTPIPSAGGPGGPFELQSQRNAANTSRFSGHPAIVRGSLVEGVDGFSLNLALESDGNVSAASFSIWIDPEQWVYKQTIGVNETDGRSFVVNDRRIARGQIGLVVSQRPGHVFDVGRIDLLRIQLDRTQTDGFKPGSIAFGDLPVERAAAGVFADSVGIIAQIEGPIGDRTPVKLTRGENGILGFQLEPLSGRLVLIEASADLIDWNVVWKGEVPLDGAVEIHDRGEWGKEQRFFRVVEQLDNGVLRTR